jgi:flagellar biosynthesis protein FlhF
MQYFTEQGPSQSEVINRIRLKYGERAKILTHKTIRYGGFLGMFSREGIEITGYISQDPGKIRKLDIETEKRKILESVKGEQTLQKVLEEIKSIKSKLDDEATGHPELHPSIEKIEQILVENDFSYTFVKRIVERLKRDLSLDDLEDFRVVQDVVAEWIGESISIYRDEQKSHPRIIILVGPTGVGKTTTIAKLAAVFGLGGNGMPTKQVRMLTIDNYRIGAKKQIETYGEIMGIPVSYVETYQDLQQKMALYQDADIILIDTIGKSPKDYVKLAEMRELLDACGTQTEVYLTMSVCTKVSDIQEIMQQFEPFNYNAVVLTKLDETMRVGNIISVLNEKGKPLAYYTDGQVVPQDIEKASVMRLLMTLEGIHINRARLQKRFPDPEVPAAGGFPADERVPMKWR